MSARVVSRRERQGRMSFENSSSSAQKNFNNTSKGLSKGAKWAIAISIIVVLIIIIAVVIWLLTRPKLNADGTVTCNSNTDCAGAAGVCNTTTGKCVVCLTNSDCSGTQECNTTTNTCFVPTCTIDTDCPSGVPRCDTETGVCVECLSSGPPDCLAGEACIAGICTAAVSCISDVNCETSELPFCDLTTGECVECNQNGDCPQAPDEACIDHICQRDISCLTVGDCLADELCISLVCTQVPCQTNNDCTEPNTKCGGNNFCVPDSCNIDADCPGDETCNISNDCICTAPVITGGSVVDDNWPTNTEFLLTGTNASDITVISYDYQIFAYDIGGPHVRSSGNQSSGILTKTGSNKFSINWSTAGESACSYLEDAYFFGCYHLDCLDGSNGEQYEVAIKFNNIIVENTCGLQSAPYCITMEQLCPDPEHPQYIYSGPGTFAISSANGSCFHV